MPATSHDASLPFRDADTDRRRNAVRDMLDPEALVDEFLLLAEWLRDHGSRLRREP